MKFGFIAIVGRPNVGKSTLLNHFLGKKLSITSSKPQTTRHRILGVSTAADTQMVFLDTPGIHLGQKKAINKYMNKAALATLSEVDVVLFLVDGLKWTEEDQWVLKQLKKVSVPVILAVNKNDTVKDRSLFLPHLKKLSEAFDFKGLVPISAKTGDHLDVLRAEIEKHLSEEPHFYSAEQITDRTDRFVASEMVREKLMRNLGQELPYELTVAIDAMEKTPKIIKVAATIFLERSGQKKIVIGSGGEGLKRIGTEARKEMESYFESKVFLKLWVKVKSGWSDSEKMLNQLGYD